MSGSVKLAGSSVRSSGSAVKPFDVPKWLVMEAWEKVRSNKGAPGVDGAAVEDFEKDLRANLYKIWNRMSSGSYFPSPVREVRIPKPDGGIRVWGYRRSLTVWRRRWWLWCWSTEPSGCFIRVPTGIVPGVARSMRSEHVGGDAGRTIG